MSWTRSASPPPALRCLVTCGERAQAAYGLGTIRAGWSWWQRVELGGGQGGDRFGQPRLVTGRDDHVQLVSSGLQDHLELSGFRLRPDLRLGQLGVCPD